jgi:amphi-Trp domain-containing protein
MSKNTFSYDKIENIDSLFNYLNTLNKGLKDRHISFGNDKDLLEFSLPEEVRFKIEAKAKRKSASISVEIKWNLPVDSNKKDCDSKKVTNSKKSEKKKIEKELKEKNKSKNLAQINESLNKKLIEKNIKSPKNKPTATTSVEKDDIAQ